MRDTAAKCPRADGKAGSQPLDSISLLRELLAGGVCR